MTNTNDASYNLSMFVIRKASRIARDIGFGYVEADDAPNTYEQLQDAYTHSLRKHHEESNTN